jgi:hypothetical protein
MEKDFIFREKKTQNCEDISSPQIDLSIKKIPKEKSSKLFCYINLL